MNHVLTYNFTFFFQVCVKPHTWVLYQQTFCVSCAEEERDVSFKMLVFRERNGGDQKWSNSEEKTQTLEHSVVCGGAH